MLTYFFVYSTIVLTKGDWVAGHTPAKGGEARGVFGSSIFNLSDYNILTQYKTKVATPDQRM